MMKLYEKEDVTKIFNEEKILIGNADAIPEYKAVEIFGREAVDFAKSGDRGAYNSNGYGIGDFTLMYLTLNGLYVAATYVNICRIRDANVK